MLCISGVLVCSVLVRVWLELRGVVRVWLELRGLVRYVICSVFQYVVF